MSDSSRSIDWLRKFFEPMVWQSYGREQGESAMAHLLVLESAIEQRDLVIVDLKLQIDELRRRGGED